MYANPDEPRNPYQPPGHESRDTGEQKYARRLLSFRDRPVTIVSIYGAEGTPKRLAILIIYFGLSTAFFAWVNAYPAAFLMLGILIGSLANGFGLARKSVRFWPIQRQLMDWNKVERMAGGELLAGDELLAGEPTL
jgi:hypothetical protein